MFRRAWKFIKTLPLRLLTYISSICIFALVFSFNAYAAETIPDFSASFKLYSSQTDSVNPVSNSNPMRRTVVRQLYSPATGSFLDYGDVASSSIGYQYYAIFDVSYKLYFYSSNANDMPQYGSYQYLNNTELYCYNDNTYDLYFSHCYFDDNGNGVIMSTDDMLSGSLIQSGSFVNTKFYYIFNDTFVAKASASSNIARFDLGTIHFVFYALSGSYYGGSSSTFGYAPGDFYCCFVPSYPSGLTITLTQNNLVSTKPVAGEVQDIEDALKDQWQRDEDDATQAGEDASSLVTEMQSLESKWEILWLPIKFTSQVISVFSGGSAARAYIDNYGFVTGYEYDEDSGFLVPIRAPIMLLNEDVAGSASITWPEYTLPILDVKLWDSYTFDLSTIKDSFPALFNALYVLITILEVYWFVAFIRDKYEEVFGG